MHELLSYNIIGDIQYRNRYNGFNGELHFLNWFRANRNSTFSEGGVFIPLVDTDNSFKEAIYALVVQNPILDFHKEQLVTAKPLAQRGQFLFSYDQNENIDSWNDWEIKGSADIAIPYPSSLKVFTLSNGSLIELALSELKNQTGITPAFHRRANISDSMKNHFISKLMQYDHQDILNTYLTRFILDGIFTRTDLNRKVQRGAPLDVDGFVFGTNNKWNILEIKEKNLSAKGCFGMDVRRINSLQKLAKEFSTKSFYIVRKINDQKNRDFVEWRIISMDKFEKFAKKNTVEGGTGMRRTSSSNPTKLCEESYFKYL